MKYPHTHKYRLRTYVMITQPGPFYGRIGKINKKLLLKNYKINQFYDNKPNLIMHEQYLLPIKSNLIKLILK